MGVFGLTWEPHVRAMPTRWVDPQTLRIDEGFKYDRHFQKLYQQASAGKSKLALTRLPADSIRTGFYQRNDGKSEHVSNRDDESISVIQAGLRRGCRPGVTVYWSSIRMPEPGWVCPDDENTLGAYIAEGITQVPTTVLAPKLIPAENAAFVFKKFDQAGFSKSIAPAQLVSLPKIGESSDELQDLKLAISNFEGLKEKVAEIDQSNRQETALYEMLSSVLSLQLDNAQLIAELLGRGFVDQAMALLRQSYEGMLNYYLDWLHPEHFGKRLQYFAYIKSLGKEAFDKDTSIGNFKSLYGNTAQKAALNPVGTVLHELIYADLSDVVHQTYLSVEQRAPAANAANLQNISNRLLSLQNVILTSIGRWISIEIGKPIH